MSVNIRMIEIKRRLFHHSQNIYLFTFQRKKFAENPFAHLRPWTICSFSRTSLFSVSCIRSLTNFICFYFPLAFLLLFILVFYWRTCRYRLFSFSIWPKTNSWLKHELKLILPTVAIFPSLPIFDLTEVPVLLNVVERYSAIYDLMIKSLVSRPHYR